MVRERGWVTRRHTEFPAPNFFSVPTTAPERWAALSAAFPRTTVSRDVAPPRDLLPILVTESQSSMMSIEGVFEGES
jgi:hypothetical protein